MLGMKRKKGKGYKDRVRRRNEEKEEETQG